MGGRARGANATMASAFESTYGTAPGSGYIKAPFVSSTLGEERPLIESDLLGLGREPQDPTPDVATNDGDVVVPVDARNFGRWLKLAFGAPTTTGTPAQATGTLTFASQPTANSTVTINGVVFTFVASGATGNQVTIGANLAATLTSLAAALNASTSAALTVATYAASATVLTVTYANGGTSGNAFTIAAGSSPASNATASGATLAGGASATHVFKSGALSLPSMAIEIGNPEVPSYTTNYGARLNQLKIAMGRGGLLNATCSLVCKGETDPVGATTAGTPTALAVARFAQASGAITRNGVPLGSVVSAEFTYTNNLDKVDTIQPDGRIEDADPGMSGFTASITVKFSDLALLTAATNGTPLSLTFGWALGGFTLLFTVSRVFLPKVKRPINGPGGIQASFNLIGSGATGNVVSVQLVNDVANYN